VPTYAYTCTACGHAFDVHQSFDDAALTVCPECQGRLRKVFSPVGVVFKGSGFYRTDARNGTTTSPSTGSATSTDSSPASSSTPAAAPAAAASSSTHAPSSPTPAKAIASPSS